MLWRQQGAAKWKAHAWLQLQLQLQQLLPLLSVTLPGAVLASSCQAVWPAPAHGVFK